MSRGYLRPIFQNVMICYLIFVISDAPPPPAVRRRRNYVRRGLAQLRGTCHGNCVFT